MTNDTLLLRQVNPGFIQNDRPSSQVFRPTPKDHLQLSVYDGDQIEPEASWKHFTDNLGYKSCGVLAVTVKECQDQGLDAIPDPIKFKEHVHIDFSALSANQVEKRGKNLLRVAIERGWLYQA